MLPLDVLALHRGTETKPPAARPIAERHSRESDFEEHRLSPTDGHTQNETTVDVEDGTLIAGWNQFNATTLLMGYARSIDGGHSWTSNLFTGQTVTSDPAIKSGGGGRWYFGYLASGGPGGSDIDIYLRRSTNDGLTWENPIDVSQNGNFDDKPYLDAAGDHLVVAWADFGYSPAKVSVAVSDDGGQTFTDHTVLADHSIGGNGACPVIGPEGNDYVFWRDSFQDSLWISRSLDQGATWSQDRGIVAMDPLPSSFPPGYRIINIPSAAANPQTGELLVVWNDQRFGDPDILAIRSNDFGLTWSEPIRVNDDAGTEAQFFPWVAYDPNGLAHVIWYDKREDGYSIDVYYTRSIDNGQSFETNMRVTGEAFTPILPGDTSTSFIGDYNGIAADGAFAYPCYQDSRDGNQDVYVALIPIETSGVADQRFSPSPRLGQFVAAPVPFRNGTRISWRGESLSRPVALEILDVTGRRIRDLTLNVNGSVHWDGCDNGGASTPAGVYYARQAGSNDPQLRLVRTR